MLLALAGSSLGYALLAFTTDFAVLLLIAAIPIAIGAAAFSQSIALVKRHFDRSSLRTANRAIGVLRASWSLAWAIGPAIGAAVVGAFGFRGVFFTSAASGVLALVTLALVRARPVFGDAAHGNRRKPDQRSSDRTRFRGHRVVSHRDVHGFNPTSHRADHVAGGAKSDVGLTFTLCAALEIVVMGALIWRPLKRGERTAIVVGFAAFVAYFVALALAQSVGLVFWAQILLAIGIALVTYLGIGFLQSLLPHRAGPPRRCFRTPVKWGPCSQPSASAPWRRRSATHLYSSHARY